MSSREDAERLRFASATELLREGFGKITGQLAAGRDYERDLADKTLLALNAWTEGENETVTAECQRRAAQYELLLHRFTAGEVERRAIVREAIGELVDEKLRELKS